MRKVIVALVLTGLVLVACSAPRAPAPLEESAASKAAQAPVAPAREIAQANAGPTASDADLGPSPRMIVRHVDLSLVVQDTMAAMSAIEQAAQAAGGYITESNAYRVNEQMRASLTLRVPADKLDQVLQRLRDMAVRVDSERMSTEDVTEEYVDIESRLRNLEATEQELRALLKEVRERPNATAEDILDVHKRLTEVRGEIERLKGRQQYLANQVKLATITVQLVPDELARPIVEPGWRPSRTLHSAFRALVNALKRLADIAIWLVVFVLPILVLIVIPFAVLFFIVRWLWHRRRAAGG